MGISGRLTASTIANLRAVALDCSSATNYATVGKLRPVALDCSSAALDLRVTVLLLSNLGTFVIRIRILCIVHVFRMYFACILMCPVHIHQDTSRYIKIHQDPFVSFTLLS